MTIVRAVRDEGLQAERTALAWNRTGMAVLVNGILVLRAGLLHESRPLSALAVIILLAAASTIGYGARRKAQLAAATRPPSIGAVALALVAAVALAASLAGLFAIGMESAR